MVTYAAHLTRLGGITCVTLGRRSAASARWQAGNAPITASAHIGSGVCNEMARGEGNAGVISSIRPSTACLPLRRKSRVFVADNFA